MSNTNDKATTITIGDTANTASTSNLINSTNANGNKINNNQRPPSNKESNQLFNGFNLIERNVIFIFDQLNYMIRTRFQSSSDSTLFAPAICFILVFIYFLNLLSSPRASNELDIRTDDFHRTESIVSSTLTLVPGVQLN